METAINSDDALWGVPECADGPGRCFQHVVFEGWGKKAEEKAALLRGHYFLIKVIGLLSNLSHYSFSDLLRRGMDGNFL